MQIRLQKKNYSVKEKMTMFQMEKTPINKAVGETIEVKDYILIPNLDKETLIIIGSDGKGYFNTCNIGKTNPFVSTFAKYAPIYGEEKMVLTITQKTSANGNDYIVPLFQ